MSEATEARLNVHIRWMVRRDMEQVLGIEQESFPQPWTDSDFVRALRRRNCIGMVAERKERVVGFMVYELYAERLELLNLAVATDRRRLGVGRQLLDKLRGKLGAGRRSHFAIDVPENSLDAQLWLRACGAKATRVVANPGGDAYRFVISHPTERP